MKQRFFIILLFLFLFGGENAYAQIFHLKGQVSDTSGAGISGAYLIFEETGYMVMTNDSGHFNLELEKPVHHLLIKKPGFVSQKIHFPYHHNEHIKLTLEEVKPDVAPFDAERVVRLAIDRRTGNEDDFVSYQAEVYKKNVARIKAVPFEIWKISGLVIPSFLDSGVVFVSEKTARFDYQDPNNFDEQVHTYQTAGRISIPGWHYLPDLDISLYHPRIFLKNISTVAYNSPLAPRSINYYHFYPAGQYYEGRHTVYRIRLEPRKKYSPNFSGFIEIYGDSLYQLSSVSVSLGDRNMLEVIDSLNFEQVFYHTDTAYHQAMQSQLYHMQLLGFDGTYSIYTFFYEHNFFNPDSAIQKYDAQVVSLADSNIARGEVWDNLRPFRIPPEEQKVLNEEPHHNRWIYQEQTGSDPLFEERPFKWYDFVGAGYDFDQDEFTTNLHPVWYGLGYNTVEGTYLKYWVDHTRYFTNSQLYIRPNVRYGFSSKTFYYDLKGSYLFDLSHPKKLGIHTGHSIRQFNDEQPILPIINGLYTLFLSKNYMKLYGQDFVELSYDFEPVNGLEVSLKGEFSSRFPVYNSTDFQIIGNPFAFTPNNPEAPPVISSSGFDPHKALSFQVSLVYQFNQLYKMINGRKVNLSSTDPKLYLNYYKGLPTAFTQTNFDHINMGLSLQKHFGRIGLSKVDINGGRFLNNAYVPFVDFRHFNGIQTFFLQPAPRRTNSIRQFSTLPYYEFSTHEYYFEAHFEHDFSGLLLGSAPLLAPLKLHAFLG
ncbi:MAG: DUF5686 family protein, partial [Owenweeksia sp.]